MPSKRKSSSAHSPVGAKCHALCLCLWGCRGGRLVGKQLVPLFHAELLFLAPGVMVRRLRNQVSVGLGSEIGLVRGSHRGGSLPGHALALQGQSSAKYAGWARRLFGPTAETQQAWLYVKHLECQCKCWSCFLRATYLWLELLFYQLPGEPNELQTRTCPSAQ